MSSFLSHVKIDHFCTFLLLLTAAVDDNGGTSAAEYDGNTNMKTVTAGKLKLDSSVFTQELSGELSPQGVSY